MADTLPAGIALAAAAAVSFEAAYLIQAFEARRDVPLLRNPRWLAGTALAAVGAALQLLALHYAPLVVVQPVLALGVVALVAVGGRIFGEPAGAGDLIATLVLAGGIVLLTVAGSDLEQERVHAVGVVIALGGLAVLTLAGLRVSLPPLLVVSAGAADALAALVAARLSAALDPLILAALGWFVLGASAIAASLSVEMRAVRAWPVTRVGPFVLVFSTVVPVLLAPIVAGENWSDRAGFVVAGLVLVALGAARLAQSAGLLEGGKTGEHDLSGGGEIEPAAPGLDPPR